MCLCLYFPFYVPVSPQVLTIIQNRILYDLPTVGNVPLNVFSRRRCQMAINSLLIFLLFFSSERFVDLLVRGEEKWVLGDEVGGTVEIQTYTKSEEKKM